MESPERIAKLEAQMDALKEDVTEVKHDIKEIHSRITTSNREIVDKIDDMQTRIEHKMQANAQISQDQHAEIKKDVGLLGLSVYWRYYWNIVLPQLGPALATAFVLLAVALVRTFDIVAVMTSGGPGSSSEVPAKFIIDHLFGRNNIGLASAASVVMLITVFTVLTPLLYWRSKVQSRLSAGH